MPPSFVKALVATAAGAGKVVDFLSDPYYARGGMTTEARSIYDRDWRKAGATANMSGRNAIINHGCQRGEEVVEVAQYFSTMTRGRDAKRGRKRACVVAACLSMHKHNLSATSDAQGNLISSPILSSSPSNTAPTTPSPLLLSVILGQAVLVGL